MKIGILAAGAPPENLIEKHGTYADMFIDLFSCADRGFLFRVYDIRYDDFPAETTECDGWIITGSGHCVEENLPWMVKLKQLILNIYVTGRPMIATCFGHQIVASAMGADVGPYAGGWGVGLQTFRLDMKVPFISEYVEQFSLNAMHRDQVLTKPDQAEVLASSDYCQYAGLLYSDRILTLQIHPEFSLEYTYDLIAVRAESGIDPERVAEGQASVREGKVHFDRELVTDWFIRFLCQKDSISV
ncbi:glutamine amidotransferase-related protein [Oceanospirillum sediminis]|uniref:Glutamine amidotransferase n=1 Tax=Oceanospirillum sediminis TaxID=2760088 RepID=A0A839IWM1_9GAMM|nr:glutamine amidotransferase [Oceanospirillum sediminis]MBB1489024.1 glutamine amidotransferase [Oceanospirillum sediminis]